MLSDSSSKGRQLGDNNSNNINFSSQSPIKKRRRRRRGGEEEEPVLRTTCDNCTGAKVKCNGDKPCGRCKSKGIHCEFTFKKRCGPKRRKGIDGARGLGCNDGLLAPYARGARVGRVLGVDDHLRVMVNALNKDEVECVKVFMQNLNSFLPLTTFETVKKAATTPAPETPEGGTGSSDDSQDEELHQLHHARKALLHGTIAVGAEFLEKDEASITHAGIARQEIKECFDAAVPEMGAAYLILALYWTHQMDSSKIARYMGLAHQSKEIICPPSAGLVASLTFVSVFLYDAKVVPTIGCRVDPPGPAKKPGSPTFNTTAAYQERVLRILSFVLLSIHNRSYRSQDPAFPTGNWSPKGLSEYIREANALLDRGAADGPNDMSRCVVMVLQAYFLLLSGDRTQAVVVAEKLVDLVADNPLVLHLAIVSSLVGSVRALLECANRTIAVERLQSAMEPLSSRVGLSNGGSKIEKELTSTFVAKQRNSNRGGGGAAAAAAAAAANQPSRESILAKQKAQTSSLNVTAGDYHNNPLNRAPVDLLHLEPSPAPRRRALPRSTTITNAPPGRGSGVKRGGEVPRMSSSLMSMSSSSGPLLASSPPRSRGTLSRAPSVRGGGGGSLASSATFQRSPVSLLQLDNMSYSPEYVEAMPGAVQIPPAGDSGLPGIVPHSRSDSSRSPAMSKCEVEVEVGIVQQGGADGGGGEMQGLSLEGTKLEADRRDMMSRLQVQQSFKADAPVSLEQVESNIARLGVVHPNEGDAAINSLVTSMDLDAAAELIAARGSFIS